ncbi:MAG: alpha/beta hydrolase [Bryobacteraceae bacterium]|nr:alpha/beta hydrolase [Bryobacteraceae bacterium]
MSVTYPAADAALLRDVEYGRAGDVSLRMDGESPDGTGPFPAVILVHGGGWMRGDRTQSVQPLFTPLLESGFAWFSISYRLVTDFMQVGTAVADVKAAVQHLRKFAARYNVDPDRIAVIGESAGGHLASMAALEEPALVAAVVAFYAPTDLCALVRSSANVPEQIREALRNSVLGPLLESHLSSLSPVDRVSQDAPPFLLIHGTADNVVPYTQSVEMQKRMTAAGTACELVTVSGGGHGIRPWESAMWKNQMLDWLRKHLI